MEHDNCCETSPGTVRVVKEETERQEEGMDLAKELKDIPPKEDDAPDVQQTSLVVCSLIIGELQAGNEKYNSFFYSSKEALGAIREEYMEVEEVLRKVKAINGYALDEESLRLRPQLKQELTQLAAMCIKAAYSLCDLSDDCAKFSETLRQQAELQATAEELFKKEQ